MTSHDGDSWQRKFMIRETVWTRILVYCRNEEWQKSLLVNTESRKVKLVFIKFSPAVQAEVRGGEFTKVHRQGEEIPESPWPSGGSTFAVSAHTRFVQIAIVWPELQVPAEKVGQWSLCASRISLSNCRDHEVSLSSIAHMALSLEGFSIMQKIANLFIFF